ncbi:hypothetical protein F441_17778 [Phytophthora nicotianae CJ01A1]|uniref:Uncharacterized protein n=4 Tax=Phytophthora nicotianae TaxID=4792 RepID=V9EC18_PHYNI|nr:hypothetical protein F443_17906 [Phytophthora nicotianae P1569]ETK76066.1 hypothetical protein L915_17431 [Phytophthora nicotianae]ETP05640.1 hypothetical protein F441_17778 [Phytophthora nicotianae CJ01A1]ETL29504.1 hypothetical protein L916_17324 [Phytophthora nicotianae]ETL82729.1 hypothetical protein L917_17153 [Phytophthora nicotianae]
MGNEGPFMDTTYSQYAVIAWPAAKAVEKAFEHINTEAAIKVLHDKKRRDAESIIMKDVIYFKMVQDAMTHAAKYHAQ